MSIERHPWGGEYWSLAFKCGIISAMSTENEPTGYQFKHYKHISLDEYKGVARDIMDLNDPVADGFMRVSDMRGDIVIIQKPQDRVRDYDDIGFVKVAKFLKMPRMDFWGGNHLVQVKKDNDVWYVAVNDQDLADQVSRTDDKRKFDDKYVEAFKEEVNKGLVACLKREKLLNGGKYNTAFLTGYIDLGLHAAGLSVVLSVGAITRDPAVLGVVGSYVVAKLALINGFNNALTWNHTEKSPFSIRRRHSSEILSSSIGIDYDEPFVKHSLPEFLLPTAPVDRLARGMLYIGKHGDKLIEHVDR